MFVYDSCSIKFHIKNYYGESKGRGRRCQIIKVIKLVINVLTDEITPNNSIFVMIIDLNRGFTKKDVWIANKYLKTLSTQSLSYWHLGNIWASHHFKSYLLPCS